MSASALLEKPAMARDRKNTPKDKPAVKGRVEFQAPESWILRAEKTAESLGLSLSAYIRFLVTEDMNRRESPEK